MQFQIGSFILQNFTSLKNHIQDVFVGFKKGVGTEKNIFYKWTVYQIMSYNSEQKPPAILLMNIGKNED